MASVETFFLQPFKTHRKRLVPSQRVPARTKHHALLEGERIGRSAEGVLVSARLVSGATASGQDGSEWPWQ